MTQDETTIRVTKAAHREARERKPDSMTWGEWLTDDARGYPDADAIAEALAARLSCLHAGDDAATLADALGDGDDGDDSGGGCPECGGGPVVHDLGREQRTCAECGATVAHDND